MALSFVTYTGDAATTNFSVPFGYISQTHVDVYLDGVLKTVTTDYTWFNATTIQFLSAPGAGVVVRIERATPNTARLVDFQDAGNLTEYDLDTNSNQVFYLVQETVDGFDAEAMKLDVDNEWNAENYEIKNLADPTDAQDAVTKTWAETAMSSQLAQATTQATNAAASASAASTSETNAAASEAAAASSESNAATSETNAASSASAASTSASNAATSESNAATSETNAATSHGYASDWAIKTSALVNDGIDIDYSSKNWCIGSYAQNPYGSSKRWATEVEDTTVIPGSYSALHHAAKASASATNAATSETNAATSETNAAASASAAATSAASVDTYNMMNRKNRIINGCFRVWQRGITFNSAAGGAYYPDRWAFYSGTTAVANIIRTANVGAYPFYRYMEYAVTTADTSIGATEYENFSYRIEGCDIADMMFGTASAEDITLSFWHKHTVTGTYCVSFRNGTNTRSYVAEYTQTTTNTWEKSTITLTGDTGGSWTPYKANTGLSITFSIAAGTNFHTTAGSWQAVSKVATSNQVNGVGTVGDKFCLANVQLEMNSSATEFETRPLAEEISLCERYYEKSYKIAEFPGSTNNDGIDAFILTGLTSAAKTFGHTVRFRTQKAVSATVTTYSNNTGTSGKAYDYTAAGDLTTTLSVQSHVGFKWTVTTASANNVNLACHWEAEAEL